MKLLRRRQTKPTGGYASFLHIILTAVLPIILYVLIRLDFVAFAFLAVILSKWRMFAVKLRHWPVNFRANAVDLLLGLSVVVFMSVADSQLLQVAWVVCYTGWLLFIKPQSSVLWVGLQAMIAQALSLTAIFIVWNEASEAVLVFTVWGVTYLCARHFLAAFDEAMARATAYVWAFFCASLTWLSAHWLLYYNSISQVALIITVIGYSIAALYYLDHKDKLKKGVRRQFIFLMITILLFILVFSDWSGDII